MAPVFVPLALASGANNSFRALFASAHINSLRTRVLMIFSSSWIVEFIIAESDRSRVVSSVAFVDFHKGTEHEVPLFVIDGDGEQLAVLGSREG